MSEKVISFDWDDTLFSMSDGKQGLLWCVIDELNPIQKIHDFLFEKHNEGYLIDIVTARDAWAIQEVRDYIEIYKLPIRKIHYTSGGSKVSILKKIKSILHVDDILHHVVAAELEGIPCLLVDDGRHKNNSTADQFNKILI
jgi:hypothetical protein